MSEIKHLRRRYIEHRNNAKQRDIPFLLSFEQWELIWCESGKLHLRGVGKGQYVMARPGDKGGYEIGNVVICLAETNRAERNRNYSLKGEKNPAFGKDYWKTNSAEVREKRRLRAIESGKVLGKYVRTPAMRAEQSLARKGRPRSRSVVANT